MSNVTVPQQLMEYLTATIVVTLVIVLASSIAVFLVGSHLFAYVFIILIGCSGLCSIGFEFAHEPILWAVPLSVSALAMLILYDYGWYLFLVTNWS